MFTSPLLVTALLTEHMDNRFRRGIGGSLSPERDAATSNVPFGAFVRGKQSLTQLVSEIKWVNVGCAVGLAGVPVNRPTSAQLHVRVTFADNKWKDFSNDERVVFSVDNATLAEVYNKHYIRTPSTRTNAGTPHGDVTVTVHLGNYAPGIRGQVTL